MKTIFILLCLIGLLVSKISDAQCQFSLDDQNIKTIEDCQKILEEDPDSQCCVGVMALMGKNIYFCEQFEKNATENDIKKGTDKIIDNFRTENFGEIVRARISCKSNVTAFSFSKCSAEESQVYEKYDDCSKFEKNSDSDYCCLFSAFIGAKNEKVYFCEEFNEEQVKKTDDLDDEIYSKYDMRDVQYMNCTPQIPDNDNDKQYGFYINLNMILLIYFLLF